MEKYDKTLFMNTHKYKSWTVKSPDEYKWSDVGYDGHGFAVVKGHRYDLYSLFIKISFLIIIVHFALMQNEPKNQD